MYLDKLEWPGSSDLVEFHRSTNKAYDEIDEIAEFLSNMVPRYWSPYLLPDGKTYATRDQRGQWRSQLGELHDNNGFIVLARHKSSNNRIIAVHLVKRNGNAQEAEEILQTRGGYAAEDVDPMMLHVTRKLCFDSGRLVLGLPETRRIWVSL